MCKKDRAEAGPLQPTTKVPSTSALPPAKDETFLELFAGAGGLTAAVRRAGGIAMEPEDAWADNEGGVRLECDLSKEVVFRRILKVIRERRVPRPHGGPPCRTISRALRSDRWAKARGVRTEPHPAGGPPTPLQIIKGKPLPNPLASPPSPI